MTRFVCTALCVLLVSGAASEAAGNGKDKAKGGPKSPPAKARDAGSTTEIRFAIDHVRAIRTHYAPQHRTLPPGLQKKYARTGQLPPGWQKKMQPLPVAVERTLPPLPTGYRRGVIEGHAVIYRASSGTIIDVAVVF